MPADLTLSHLRSALARALTNPENAALARLPESERTVEGLARAYMPRYVTLEGDVSPPMQRALSWSDLTRAMWPLDLTDPGTAHAVLVALALALGLDPGPAGLCAAWRPLYATEADGRRRVGWWLSCDGDGDAVYFLAAADALGDDDEVVDEAIAAEDDTIKALAAALLHTLEASDAR